MDELSFGAISDTAEVTILKASYALKIKAGNGGFDPGKIAVAERRLADATHLFPEAAQPDLHFIERVLASIKSGQVISRKNLGTIMAACIELKSHGVMFQYPLATTVADSLLQFCAALKSASPLSRQVIALHLQALKIVIEKGASMSDPADQEHLLDGLKKASEKALAAA